MHEIGVHDWLKYMKFAFTPGKSFDDEPSNVGDAHKNSDPI